MHEQLALAVAQKNAALMAAAQGMVPGGPGGQDPRDTPQGNAEQRTYTGQQLGQQGEQ
jgi:hypothetical protein